MGFTRASFWVVTVLVAALGCSSDPPASTACAPACREGYACVSGRCVEACNPACPAGERCAVSGGAPVCVRDATDAAAPTDAVTADAVTPTTDLPAAMDVNATGSDVIPATDAVAPTDSATPTSDLPALPPCGMTGQPCCGGSACYGGGQCVSGMCGPAPTRDMGECVRPEDCPAGQACIGVQECTGNRGCFRCAAPAGTGEIGTPCMSANQCRTGVCSNGRCTIPCAVGEAGDAACNAARAGYTCTNILWRSTSTAPVTTIGVCNQSCRRGGDCPTGFVCAPLLNYLADRMDFVCRAASTTSTTPIGGACNPTMPTCQNVLCLPTGMNMGYCTGVCQTDMDCTPAAPVCDTLYVIRPSGRDQITRGCHPRR